MITKKKLSNIFLFGLGALIGFSVFALSPQAVSAQAGGICVAEYADMSALCFAECEQQVDQQECEAFGGMVNAGGSLSASAIIAQQTNCSCVWQSDSGPSEPASCSDGIQNQNETGVDSGGVCYTPPAPVCGIISFSAAPSYLANSNSGSNLSFAFQDVSTGATNYPFSWSIARLGGGTLSSPPSGVDASRSGITTGSLTGTQTYTLTCGADTQDVTIAVAPPTPPPNGPTQSTCDDISANNYGGALPCTYNPSATCTDPAASNNGGSLPCTYPTPPGNVYLTPSVNTSVSCVPVGQNSYTATISWPTVQNNIRIFVDDDLATAPGFDKVVSGATGSTPVPSGFAQRMPPPAPTVLTLLPGVRYYTFIQNNSTYDGPVRNWMVPQCASTNQAVGYLDAPAANGTCPASFGGWTYDPDYPNESNSVHFYKDGVFYSGVVADAFRADLPGDKYHSFTYPTPTAWKDGATHTISLYAIDLNGDGNPQLVGSPKTMSCPAPVVPSLSVSAFGCQITAGGNTCPGAVNWSVTNPDSGSSTSLAKTNPVATVSTATSGSSVPVTLNYGSSVFTLSHSGQTAQSTANATCPAAAPWNGTICQGVMSGTITPSALSCPIPAGQSSCDVTLTWNTVNPVATSAITASGMTTVNGNSGSQLFAIPYGGRTFTLANNGQTLDTETITAGTASCASGSTWNGTTCAGASFNYSLSNSGTSSVTKGSGDVFTTNTIGKTLSAGATQSVSLSLSGVPSGVTYNLSNGTCSPTCNSVITFIVTPSATVGNHTIIVTGSPLSKTTTFTLAISGSPMTVSCTVSANSVLVGQPVTWTGSVVGGRAPLTYSWSGTNISAPFPTTNPFVKTYTTIGQKTAQLTVTDADGIQGICQSINVQVNFDPNFEEF